MLLSSQAVCRRLEEKRLWLNNRIRNKTLRLMCAFTEPTAEKWDRKAAVD